MTCFLPSSPSLKPQAPSLPKAAFLTLGCKVNQYETEAVREEVLALGYEEAEPEAAADLFVVNTCSVTGSSGVKSRRVVERLARAHPRSSIVVMGCSSPREKELLGRIPQVALLVGNEEKAMVPGLIRVGLIGDRRPAAEPTAGPLRLRVPERGDPRITRDALDLEIDRFRGRTRAFLKVQDGCSVFCSFCIIPYLRGLSRSRGRSAILEEVGRLAGSGFREIVITGIHLQDYGEDLDPPERLAGLLAAVARAARREGVRRIRLSSLGPLAFTRELVEVLRDPLFCPHWHLPLQSGDDGVLSIMRRGYSREDFLRALALLEESFDRPAITTDVLVGHPGETEAAFERTLDLCRRAGFARMHVFPFSPREGTRAARLDGRVPAEEIVRRERILKELERELAREFRAPFLGRTVDVLVESVPPAARHIEGFTDRYLRVRAPAGDPPALHNTFVRVKVTAVRAEVVEGTLVNEHG